MLEWERLMRKSSIRFIPFILLILACSTQAKLPAIQPTDVPQAKIGVVVADSLNLREYPYTAQNVLRVLELGQHVTILDKLTNDNPECQVWLFVEVDGVRGWACGKWVVPLGNLK